VFPVRATEGGSETAMAAFVVQDGRARLRRVVVGARNGTDAWIRQGLEVGETVIVYPPPAVADGVRVKARSV
jgi:HlyD family secretion protein